MSGRSPNTTALVGAGLIIRTLANTRELPQTPVSFSNGPAPYWVRVLHAKRHR